MEVEPAGHLSATNCDCEEFARSGVGVGVGGGPLLKTVRRLQLGGDGAAVHCDHVESDRGIDLTHLQRTRQHRTDPAWMRSLKRATDTLQALRGLEMRGGDETSLFRCNWLLASSFNPVDLVL